jgi:hypothetical protein
VLDHYRNDVVVWRSIDELVIGIDARKLRLVIDSYRYRGYRLRQMILANNYRGAKRIAVGRRHEYINAVADSSGEPAMMDRNNEHAETAGRLTLRMTTPPQK